MSDESQTARAAGPRIERFPNEQALAEGVALRISASVAHAIQRHGNANLVLSGGATPERYLPRVAGLVLAWEKVSILLSDERWVDEQSPASNAAMLRRILFSQPGPDRAQFISLKSMADTAAAGLAAARDRLPAIGRSYDLVLLGMGNDGHIASLFPSMANLAEWLAMSNTDRVVAVPAPSSAAPHVERISLTLAELKRSDQILLVMQGAAKLEVLLSAYRGGDPLHTPVVALGDVDVLWCP